jgi:hypothetical protein
VRFNSLIVRLREVAYEIDGISFFEFNSFGLAVSKREV